MVVINSWTSSIRHVARNSPKSLSARSGPIPFPTYNIRRAMSSTQSINPDVIPRPLVICGPSGTGKSTLLTPLLSAHPGTFGFSISHTTRAPRKGEEDGREYHFTTKDTFMQKVEHGDFLEWAQFGGNCYGTTFKALTSLAPKRCILDIELQGILQLRKKAPLQDPPLEPVYLFIAPPSLPTLKDRLKGRGTETDESMRKRLDAARAEVEYAMQGKHDIVIVNDDVEVARKKLETVMMGWPGWETCGDKLPSYDLKDLD